MGPFDDLRILYSPNVYLLLFSGLISEVTIPLKAGSRCFAGHFLLLCSAYSINKFICTILLVFA